jgi:tripartite-type tricarboxylate transporter receptor subunit TctC
MKRYVIGMAAWLACMFTGSAFAADAAMFRGKTITYIVATGPGGGYDTYGRLIVRYMQKYLPGSRILVRNVPGAGHIVGANTIYAAKPDGLTIGMFNTGLIYDQLLKRQGVMFDLANFSWIGKASDDTRVLLISKASGVRSFDQIVASKVPVKLAAPGIGSAGYIETRILQSAFKLNVQIVPGFDGNQGEMSMLRNEVAGQIGTAASLAQFVKNGNGFYALAISETDKLPGVPRAMALVKDDKGRKMIELVSILSEIGRLTAGPPGIPAPTLAVLRIAMDKTMADPQFLADARKLQLPIAPASGAEVETLIRHALAQPSETIALLKAAAQN